MSLVNRAGGMIALRAFCSSISVDDEPHLLVEYRPEGRITSNMAELSDARGCAYMVRRCYSLASLTETNLLAVNNTKNCILWQSAAFQRGDRR